MIDFCPEHAGTLHFIGIGGIGMSGIAEALHHLGYQVQGSDTAAGYNTKRLEKHGIRVMIGHDAAHIDAAISAVIVSSAIKAGNPELLEARRRKIPIVRRADMLAELMRHKMTISVAGTHGKTTTTSLVGAMLEAGNMDPTIINGGIIHAYGTNTRMGTGDWVVVESDESDGSFTRLPTTVAVVTNIDPEHMEHYGSFDAVRTAYRDFIENIPFYGAAILCGDHAEVAGLAETITDRKIYTYGTRDNTDTRAINIRMNGDGAVFDVVFSSRLTGSAPEIVPHLHLPMMGHHNVLNALVPLTLARLFGFDVATMREALQNFQGVKRRFTKTGIAQGITVIDDYGHHPVEIRATLTAARQAVSQTNGKVIAVVQPHRYSRLSSLFPEFCTAFDSADAVIVTDVYAAGEPEIEGIHRDALAQGITRHLEGAAHSSLRLSKEYVFSLATRDTPEAMTADLATLLWSFAQPNDFVICLGAGSITSWAHALPQAIDAVATGSPKNGTDG